MLALAQNGKSTLLKPRVGVSRNQTNRPAPPPPQSSRQRSHLALATFPSLTTPHSSPAFLIASFSAAFAGEIPVAPKSPQRYKRRNSFGSAK